MFTLKCLECFNWGAEDRVEVVALTNLGGFNWSAEDRMEVVALTSLGALTGVKKTGWR